MLSVIVTPVLGGHKLLRVQAVLVIILPSVGLILLLSPW